ncbi:MAG: tRNA (guanosine(46)-N7)-methyltransferase TrmB [Rhodothermia bacterium]|nr:MAG: tRNA (guanosine(46)-N7)-methyltransferase TrmB [Rhodothermia bacterium]
MIIRPSDLTFPLDTASLFQRSGPLVLEIGFGDGNYLVRLGQENQSWNILGVEMSMGSMWRAYRRMKRERVSNVRLFHGDARFIVRDTIAPRTLKKVFVNFPDPWPREKHWGNRLLQSSFFELVSTRLEDGGSIALTTDHAEYFEFAQREAIRSGVFDVEEGKAPKDTLLTKYAVKWQEQKKPIYYTLFWKSGESILRPGLVQLADMQHAVLSGDLNSIGEFSKLVHSFEGGQVVVLDAFRELAGDGLLFKVLVEESDLRQEVIIQAWEKSDGIYVGLQKFGDPLGTRGVKEAVRCVVDWLVSQGMELKQTWI